MNIEDFNPNRMVDLLYSLSRKDENGNVTFKFTMEHFLICYLVEMKDEKLIKKYIEYFGYFDSNIYKSLVDNDYIIDTGNGEVYKLHQMVVAPPFNELVIDEDESPFEEIFNLYPKHFYIEGKIAPARTGDYDELERIYNSIIKRNKKKHEKIVRITRNYVIAMKKDAVTSMGLEKWIKGRQYLNFDELDDGSDGDIIDMQ